MTAADVDLRVSPASAMSQDELRSWHVIAVQALGKYGGAVTATLVPRGDQYELAAFVWSPPGSWLLQHASGAVGAPLRKAVLDALRAAGKPVAA